METIQKTLWLVAVVIAIYALFSELFFSRKIKNLFVERKVRRILIFFSFVLILLPVTLSYIMHLSYDYPVFLFSPTKDTIEIITSLTMPISSIAASLVSQFRYPTLPIVYGLDFGYLEELFHEDFLRLDTKTQSEIKYIDIRNYVFNEKSEIPRYLQFLDYTNFIPSKPFRIGEKITFLEDFVYDILEPTIKKTFQNRDEVELNSDMEKFRYFLGGVNFIISDVINTYCGKEFGGPNGELNIDYILKYDIREKINSYKENK